MNSGESGSISYRRVPVAGGRKSNARGGEGYYGNPRAPLFIPYAGGVDEGFLVQ